MCVFDITLCIFDSLCTIRHERELSTRMPCDSSFLCIRFGCVLSEKKYIRILNWYGFKMHDFNAINMIIKTGQMFFGRVSGTILNLQKWVGSSSLFAFKETCMHVHAWRGVKRKLKSSNRSERREPKRRKANQCSDSDWSSFVWSSQKYVSISVYQCIQSSSGIILNLLLSVITALKGLVTQKWKFCH